jgi:hypothetical protein
MFAEVDDNFDPAIIDGIVDLDPDLMFSDQNSNTLVNLDDDWILNFSPSLPDTDYSCSMDDLSKIFSFDVPLNRKEWLVLDSISRRQRSPRLFEFLILLLGKPHYDSYASFTDRSKGLFYIHQPQKVAELWQAVKSRQSSQRMTYDKFARAIRWYYKSNIMQKTNTRYTFQFTSKTLRNYFIDENNNIATTSSFSV